MLKIKKIKPMFNTVVTTMDKYEDDVTTGGGLIDISKRKGALKEFQKVIAVGQFVNSVKVGDIVSINPTRYAVMKHREGSLKDGVITDNPVIDYKFNIIELDGKECLKLLDQDIDFIIEEYEEVEDPKPSKIHIPEKKLIV